MLQYLIYCKMGKMVTIACYKQIKSTLFNCILAENQDVLSEHNATLVLKIPILHCLYKM